MKKIYLILIVSSYSVSCLSNQKPSVLIHHNRVQSQVGTRVKLHNYAPHPIDVTYIPQQVVTVKRNPTKLPLARHVYANGIQHLKCVLSSDNLQKKSDRKTLELLVRKEPLGKTIAQLTDAQTLLKGHETVIRLYRKVPLNDNLSNKTCWKPILTLPETGDTDKLLEGLKVSPDGMIHLETANI